MSTRLTARCACVRTGPKPCAKPTYSARPLARSATTPDPARVPSREYSSGITTADHDPPSDIPWPAKHHRRTTSPVIVWPCPTQ
jgi:hypothetical protein